MLASRAILGRTGSALARAPALTQAPSGSLPGGAPARAAARGVEALDIAPRDVLASLLRTAAELLARLRVRRARPVVALLGARVAVLHALAVGGVVLPRPVVGRRAIVLDLRALRGDVRRVHVLREVVVLV